jgi:hypothetical protein
VGGRPRRNASAVAADNSCVITVSLYSVICLIRYSFSIFRYVHCINVLCRNVLTLVHVERVALEVGAHVKVPPFLFEFK